MIRISQVKLSVKATEDDLKAKILKLCKTDDIGELKIVKKSLDARDKDNLMYIYTVDINNINENKILRQNKNNKNIAPVHEEKYRFPTINTKQDFLRPVIIGAGPAGYFCGLYLARNGYKPIILERGKCVEERTKDVLAFWEGAPINPDSNVSFGEGGAGTFSDGKLNTGIKDRYGRIKAIIDDFIKYGAPGDIGYLNKPHIGTDELKKVMCNLRNEIISLGGEIHFSSKMTGFDMRDNGDIDVYYVSGKNDNIITTNALVLALGHSARDTFYMLRDKKLPMEPKAFAIGLRIEHLRELIDKAQYGDSDKARGLPAADYKMTFRSSKGRSVYSFCMCPGGFVVNASSDVEQSVVNGMSNHARDEINSNSAIVVNVTPEDFIEEGFGEYGVLAGVEFQKKYERLSYNTGKGAIPVQRFCDYEANRVTAEFGKVIPNIKGKYRFSNLNNCLPPYVNDAIIEGIHFYDGRLSGFADGDAVLSGIESRTSSPVRINRNENMMSEFTGVFPCGEGAGYAGGITSAAVDGIKVAEAVAKYMNSL